MENSKKKNKKMSLSNILNIQERGGDGNPGGGSGRNSSEGGSGRGGSGDGGTQLPSTPFQTQAEGDAFRAWVREKYATYASQINLSVTGPVNNDTIRRAYKEYGTLYSPASETGESDEYSEIKKDYPKITIYSRLFIFLTDNGKFYLNSRDADFGDILVNTNDKKMQLGYNLPTAFIKSVVEKYPQIIKVSVPEKIGNDKVELQFEFFKRIKGLQTILEQSQTPAKYITYKIVDGLLKKPTDDDNWKDGTNKTIRFIAGSSKTFLSVGERSDTVVRVKEALGYTKDTTPYFTEDFNTFVLKYKGTNKLDNTNGNIDQDLICSIEQYKRYCPATGAEKTTEPPTSTTSSTPTNTTVIPTTEMKYLNDYAKYVGDGIPAYGPCKSLFDYYSQQALNYIRLKKVNKAPTDTEAIKKQLEPIKEKILYCQKSSNLKDRAKLDTLITQRFRIQQGDKDNPYKMDI